MTEIPLIDFAMCGLDKENVSQEDLKEAGIHIVNALSTIGFTYLKNVGVKKELIDRVNKAFATFFASPLKNKNKYLINPKCGYHGYIGPRDENLNPNRVDYKEAFNVHGAACTDDEDFPWPDALFPEFSLVLKEFMSKCKTIAHRVLEAIAIGLDLSDKQYFVNCHSFINDKRNPTTLRGTYYAPLENSFAGQVRLGEHTDYETITLLFQDDIGGLEIENLQNEYIEVTPIDDTVLLNIADTLQFWTKYKLKSRKHRVVASQDAMKRSRTRQSLAYFVAANNGTVIDDLPIVSESKEYEDIFTQMEGEMTTDKFINLRMSKAVQ